MAKEYQLIGTFQISEIHRVELNNHVLQLLDIGGIRHCKMIQLGDKRVNIVSVPVTDEYGYICFNYSIFENKSYDECRYDTNTGRLMLSKTGSGEFHVIMILIMLLQEMYSETPCYLVHGDAPIRIDGYADLLKSLLDINPLFEHRSRLWEMFLNIRMIKGFEHIDHKWIQNMHTFDYANKDVCIEHWMAVNTFAKENILDPTPEFDGTKEMVSQTSEPKVRYYLYQEMKRLIEIGEENNLTFFMRELLNAPLEERQRLATQDGLKGIMAELSVHRLPPAFIWPYALAANIDFWEAWSRLGEKGYLDTKISSIFGDWRKDREKTKYVFPLYKAFLRDNQDEFLEFWKEEELHLSDTLKRRMKEWKADIFQTTIPVDFDMEQVLGQALYTLEYGWGYRYVDKRFVEECMEHQDDERYQRAIVFFRQLIEEPLFFFPELTREQAIKWVLRKYCGEIHTNNISAFHSLFINHMHRSEFLGF